MRKSGPGFPRSAMRQRKEQASDRSQKWCPLLGPTHEPHPRQHRACGLSRRLHELRRRCLAPRQCAAGPRPGPGPRPCPPGAGLRRRGRAPQPQRLLTDVTNRLVDGHRPAGRDLPDHDPQLAGRQRLRPAQRPALRHARAAGARQRHVRSRGRSLARDCPRHASSCLAAQRVAGPLGP